MRPVIGTTVSSSTGWTPKSSSTAIPCAGTGVVFDERNPGRHQTLSDVEFLNDWDSPWKRETASCPPGLPFSSSARPRHLRRILPRPVVDCQFIDSEFDSWSPDDRWRDRIVVEENLIQAWLVLSERYMKHAAHPFSVDATTLRRDDDPPDYISFREARPSTCSCIRTTATTAARASIRFFRDRTVFWNPGDAFATTDELLDPTEKDVRNPAIVAAFRRDRPERTGRNRRARHLPQLAASGPCAAGHRQ